MQSKSIDWFLYEGNAGILWLIHQVVALRRIQIPENVKREVGKY